MDLTPSSPQFPLLWKIVPTLQRGAFCAATCSTLVCCCLLSREAAMPSGFLPPHPWQIFSLLLAATSAQFPRRYVQLSFQGGKQAFRAAARRALAPAAPSSRPALPTSLALCLSLEARRISQASSQPESQGSRVKRSQAQHTAPPAQRREGKCTVQAAPGLARSPTDGGGS